MNVIVDEIMSKLLIKLINNIREENGVDPFSYAVACLDIWEIMGEAIRNFEKMRNWQEEKAHGQTTTESAMGTL